MLTLYDLKAFDLREAEHCCVSCLGGQEEILSALAPWALQKLHLYTKLGRVCWVLLFTCLTVGVLVNSNALEGTGLTYLLVYIFPLIPILGIQTLTLFLASRP